VEKSKLEIDELTELCDNYVT